MVETLDKQSIKTDLGLRPIDWLPIPISDFIKEFRGGAPLSPSDFRIIGFKVLPKVGVIRGGNLFIEKNKQQYCSREYADSHKSNIVDNSFTIVVLRDLVPSGPNIGLMVRINSNEIYLLAQGVYGFKVNEPIDPDFLIHVSNTEDYRKVMRNIMVGSTQVHITNGTFKQVQIPLPPTKTEQTAIATALNDADALIHQLEQLLTKKQNIKTGAMQELLKAKEGWEVKKLGEIFDITAGGDFKKDFSSETQNEKYPFPIYSNSLQNYGAYGFSTYYTNEADCITVTARGTIGYSCYRNHRFTAIGRLLVLKPNQNLDCFYFSEYINNKIQFVLEVTGVPQLTAPQISKYEVSFPKNKTEQTNIAQILSDMDNEIHELEKKLEKYKILKQGMMQSLLTGKIRLI